MKILGSHKISSEILDLIYEAKEYLIIVSPFVNFKNWEAIVSALRNAKARKVRIDFFVRHDEQNSATAEQVEELDITPRLIKNLHAKFYMNEKDGIISSMNLLSFSHSNSIEIGCKLETSSEHEELRRFVKDFVCTNEIKPAADAAVAENEPFATSLKKALFHAFKREIFVADKDGALNINTGRNNYYLKADKKKNVIISGILSMKEADTFEARSKYYFNSTFFSYKLDTSIFSEYDQVIATTRQKVSHSDLNHLALEEKTSLLAEVCSFIKKVQEFKDSYR